MDNATTSYLPNCFLDNDTPENKIDCKIIKKNDSIIIKEMKPIYLFNKELLCGVIEYGSNTYYLENEDKDKIINFEKKFVFNTETDTYPSFNYNNKRINYLEFVFGYKENGNVNYIFKNGNKCDLRKCNVICEHIYNETIIKNYSILEYIPGHYSKNGVDPYFMKNPIWKIQENGKELLLMYCEKDTICNLCHISYQKILDYEKVENKKLTFHKHVSGYVLSSNSSLFIHQIITSCHGNGKGTKNISVDHIDRNPLNNTFGNLRIATREEQENNCKGIMDGTKRERKTSAKPLPEGLTQQMLKKYVVYYHEWLNKEKTRSREFFKIEKHPKLDKIWVGTKSNKVPILEKLQQANQFVENL